MNVIEEILKEHSRKQAIIICEYACLFEERFSELMVCFLSTEYRIAQRAAWAVSMVATKKPAYVQPYIPVLVSQLSRKDVHDAIVRNSLRILQNATIPEELHGEVMNVCFARIADSQSSAAIKAFSLTVLEKLCKSYPEIRQELILVIEERWDIESPAFKSRARKILRNNVKRET